MKDALGHGSDARGGDSVGAGDLKIQRMLLRLGPLTAPDEVIASRAHREAVAAIENRIKSQGTPVDAGKTLAQGHPKSGPVAAHSAQTLNAAIADVHHAAGKWAQGLIEGQKKIDKLPKLKTAKEMNAEQDKIWARK